MHDVNGYNGHKKEELIDGIESAGVQNTYQSQIGEQQFVYIKIK
jgi:hypothetical protein